VWGKNAVRRGTRAALVVTGGAMFLLVPVAAHADTPPYGGGRTVVSPTSVENTTTTDPATPAHSSGDSLPFTGGDIAGLAAIGAGAVGVGIVASRARRQRTA
jgi:hypothetical protein